MVEGEVEDVEEGDMAGGIADDVRTVGDCLGIANASLVGAGVLLLLGADVGVAFIVLCWGLLLLPGLLLLLAKVFAPGANETVVDMGNRPGKAL